MDTKKYDEKWFWAIIGLVQRDRSELKKILEGFTREEIEHFQDIFVEFAVELKDEPYTDYMESSEDGIEDVANWIVSGGKMFYEQVLKKPELAPRSVWGKNEENLYGVADEVFYDKFNESMGIY
jgi:hypothetical protein